MRHEGIGFLTKTLPRLGKAFDKALTGHTPLTATALGFESQCNSELPLFCGEFFNRVLSPTGTVLQDPCAVSVRVLRQILYLFYKYELPYSDELEQKVVSSFVKTEEDLFELSPMFAQLEQTVGGITDKLSTRFNPRPNVVNVTIRARELLRQVFAGVDLKNINPKHGPGTVATKQQLWGKYEWTNVSGRIRKHFPLHEYFCSCLDHACDRVREIASIGYRDLPAQVLLVPKDSRGPRLISCEPVDFQWIQQGISRVLVQHIESLPLTSCNVFFTDQNPNRNAALYGSRNGKYSTLDLKEASDRVSLDLVRLLFPPDVFDILSSARSSSTVLPNGQVLWLQKFAPMGSALCFPILALTVWAILTAAAPDADTQERILVYGDDVIVPTAFAVNAMINLESFGLLINRDKSCTSGFFRESCGMDAFQGIPVTPVRLRTPWSWSPSPECYTSWISYANSLYDNKYHHSYDLIVGMLYRVYGRVPDASLCLEVPHLREVPEYMLPKRFRINRNLQKREWLVRDVRVPTIRHAMDGWNMLLRFFAETSTAFPLEPGDDSRVMAADKAAFSVRSYTRRRTSMLVRRWR
jgi:hypothetical protein